MVGSASHDVDRPDFMFWQESDLQTAPSYFTKTQAFEPLDEAGPLSIVGLDPALIRPFPSEANQLVNLLSETTKAELLAKIDGPVDINVVRSEPNFSLTSYYGTEGRNRFSLFRSEARPTRLLAQKPSH